MMGFASLYPSYKRYEFAFSRRDAPELYMKLVPQKIRGRRESRVP